MTGIILSLSWLHREANIIVAPTKNGFIYSKFYIKVAFSVYFVLGILSGLRKMNFYMNVEKGELFKVVHSFQLYRYVSYG